MGYIWNIFTNNFDKAVSPSIAVLTSATTDDGTAIPASNNLNILGGSGVETYADPNLSDNVFIKVQNSFTEQAQTIGATTADITTITLPEIGTYTIEIRATAWEATTPAGAGFSKNGVVRTDGITAVLIGDADGFAHKDSVLSASDVSIIVVGNTAVVQVLGVAGLTVNWGAFTVYINRGV